VVSTLRARRVTWEQPAVRIPTIKVVKDPVLSLLGEIE